MSTTNGATLRKLLVLPIIALAAISCAPDGDEDTSRGRAAPLDEDDPAEAAGEGFAAPSGAHLAYYGGPVMGNVKVWAVFWNASVPNQSTLASFYGTITGSAHFDWLTEYNTPKKAIGHGTLAGTLVDTGAPAGKWISDAQIQAEISRLIGAGALPPPDADTLYMMHLPPGATVIKDSYQSCAQFCAYHGTFVRSGAHAYYGVIPDLSPCAGVCGGGSLLDNTTSIASHELVEAVTDPEVGLATSIGTPLAWYDQVNGEIGDICNGQHAMVEGYVVQKEFSNQLGACITTKAGGSGGNGGGGMPGAACSHPICASGVKLPSGCGPCTTAICSVDPYCCSTAWDGKCVAEVASVCHRSCP